VLRRQIASGQLRAGERLYEERIAARLGVSKTPVRLALQRLHQESMVDFQTRRGFTVATFTSQDIRDVVQLREMLEAIAVRRLAEKPNTVAAARLRNCFTNLEGNALGGIDGSFAAADLEFHRRLIELAGSTLVSRMMSQLDIRIEMYLVRGPAIDANLRLRLHAEHFAIIDAVEAGACDRAEYLIREHIRDAWEITKAARLESVTEPAAADAAAHHHAQWGFADAEEEKVGC